MTLYTVHEPGSAPDMVTRADRTVVMPDHFNIWGFLFGTLFLIWHRLWLALAVWVGLVAAIALACAVFSLSAVAFLPVALLAHLFIGVEGNDLRRWALERRGYRFASIVSGEAREDAELVFFQHRMIERSEQQTSAPTRTGRPEQPPTVIGMFDDDGTA